jgi:Domain of unknown function (DUF4347)
MSQSLFRLVLLIFVVATSCSLIAQPALAGTAAFNCPPCPTLNHVVLMIGLPSNDSEARNQTQLWIAKHSLAAQQLHRQRTGETIPTITKYPANVADFRRDLQQIAIACMRVEALGIMSHGNIGYLLIGTDGVNEHNLDDVFGHGLGCVMSPQASIEFAGCNVGRGCRGADFMRAVADRLLPQGGTVTAPEQYVFGSAILGIAPRSIWGDRELQVTRAGSPPRWTRGAEPGPECAVDRPKLNAQGQSSER